MVLIANSETAVVITGSLGRRGRQIRSKLGHNAGRVAIADAAVGKWRLLSKNVMSMEVVLGEMTEGISGIESPGILFNSTTLNRGNKGSLGSQNRRAEKNWGDRGFRL